MFRFLLFCFTIGEPHYTIRNYFLKWGGSFYFSFKKTHKRLLFKQIDLRFLFKQSIQLDYRSKKRNSTDFDVDINLLFREKSLHNT